MGTFIDFRAKSLRPIFYRIGFRDVQFDEGLQTYVPNLEYSGAQLKNNPFKVKDTFHEISKQYPVGNFVPFLTQEATEENNEVILNIDEIEQIRVVASAEWQKPGEKFLSAWSTSAYLDLTKAKEFRINLILDQVSIGREALISAITFSPVVDPKLEVDRNVNLSLELIRIDAGVKLLAGSWRASHRINLDETLLLELPRGQWFYSVRNVEM